MPFSISSTRDSHKEVTKVPGPGAYIDIFNPANSSSCKNFKKIADEKTIAMSQGTKLAAFGSKVERGAEWQNIKNEKRLFRY